jgi:glycosyltransferase involved in cell wall biosynthesis
VPTTSAINVPGPVPGEAAPGASRRRLLYVEPEADGHHIAVYASAIWEKMIEEGWDVVWVTSRHAAGSRVAAELIRRFGGNLEVHAYPFLRIPSSGEQPLAWFRYQTHHRRLLKEVIPKLVRQAPTHCIFMPWLDYCDRACGMLGLPSAGVPVAALHMHVSIHEPLEARASWLRRASRTVTRRSMARLYAQKPLKRVAVIMESFVSFARDARIPGWEKLVYVPDVGSLRARPPRDECRIHFSLGARDIAVLCFGALTKRKGVMLLLDAAKAYNGNGNVVVILAGAQDPETRSLVAEFRKGNRARLPRIIVRDEFVDSEEEHRLFSAADIVWVGYPGFLGSSGVLIQAGCAGLPVISGKQGETGRTVRVSQSGMACDLGNPAEIEGALRALADNPWLRVRLGKNGAARSQMHSPAQFAANILRIIEETASSAVATPT